MRGTLLIVAALALFWAAPANAHVAPAPDNPGRMTLWQHWQYQSRAIEHYKGHLRWIAGHKQLYVERFQENRMDEEWGYYQKLKHAAMREQKKVEARLCAGTCGPHVIVSRLAQSWSWYFTSATQCVTNHEGGWTSSGNPPYQGRFQKDASFELETAFGRWAVGRWGRSSSQPHWVQVYQAYEVWLYAGWSRWPTFARYCS